MATFDGDAGGPALADLCRDLLTRQKTCWPRLREGYLARGAAETREIPCPDYTLTAQWNPQRIVSSAASVDPAAIQARPCFLCPDNLPAEQQAILYRRQYLVLCNPAPIFSEHYTVVHRDHRPQAIVPALDTLLLLMQDLSPHFTLLYNGPRSGASAPDHLHFQAAPAGAIPVEADISRAGRLLRIKRIGGADLYRAVDMGRAILVLKGSGRQEVASALPGILAAMQAVAETDDEPMLNLLGSYRQGQWMLLVFPRRRHRPSVFDLQGDAKVLITPAAVEMGGLLITPLEKDFRRLDARLVRTIYQDVSVEEEVLACLVDAL